jgi:hypothetical protein
MSSKNRTRAVRYRQLALAEPDNAKAAILYQIADEADREVLCTVDSTNIGFMRRGVQKFPPKPLKHSRSVSHGPQPKP